MSIVDHYKNLYNLDYLNLFPRRFELFDHHVNICIRLSKSVSAPIPCGLCHLKNICICICILIISLEFQIRAKKNYELGSRAVCLIQSIFIPTLIQKSKGWSFGSCVPTIPQIPLVFFLLKESILPKFVGCICIKRICERLYLVAHLQRLCQSDPLSLRCIGVFPRSRSRAAAAAASGVCCYRRLA